MRGAMGFGFEPDGPWGGLTTTQATELVAHLPLTIDELYIDNADYIIDFIMTLIERIKYFHNMKELYIWKTSVGGKEEGQEAGSRLAEIMSCNATIKDLLLPAGLIGVNNFEQWGIALMENKALTRFLFNGELGDEIVDQLKMKTKDRTPELEIRKSNF